MANDERSNPNAADEITDKEFNALRQLIYRETGIALSDGKREMLCSRLGKRLRHHGFSNYGAYYQYLMNTDIDGSERLQMINCITTNKTDFFREHHHFDFLRDRFFPELLERAKQGGPRKLRIWSAACSTGEEPYTLAMMIREHFGPPPGWDVKILASDIDSDVLARAEHGVYDQDRISEVPQPYRQKYFLAGRGENDGRYKVHSDLQDLIAFRRINFMDESWPVHTKFDVIFCRNVIIYFDRPTQQRLFERFESYMNPEAYLIVGHSENLYGITNRFVPLGNTIHALSNDAKAKRPIAPEPTRPTPPPPQAVEKPRLPERTIIAGEVFASKQPTCVSTLLGSCIAACLFDPKAGVGGMNHFMLPDGIGSDSDSARFGVNAMELLINDIMRQGGERRRIQAKVFGGAKVIEIKGKSLNVGDRNAEFVRQFLSTESIPIVSEYLGGTSGLKVRFLTHTGQAFVKAFDGRALTEVVKQEETRSKAMVQEFTQAASNVTLF